MICVFLLRSLVLIGIHQMSDDIVSAI